MRSEATDQPTTATGTSSPRDGGLRQRHNSKPTSESRSEDMPIEQATQPTVSDLRPFFGFYGGKWRDAIKEAIKKIDANIKKLTDELARMAPENLRASQVKSSLLRAASEVFDAAVDRYKRDLRGKVESTASDLFLRMTTEGSDYERLEITESYGLNIIHKDSRIEEGRSAGAEHVVALALMGALQANAPLRGPIVMDSPFGRLDEGHTKNVVAALPTMAPQVVLLVHEAELRRNNVREILGSRLLRVYELVKVSARRTRIEPVR